MLVQEQRGVSGRSHSTKTQCLFPPPKVSLESPLYCNSGWPSLVWAGDLDGDRILDLVFDIRSDSTYERKLFLSKGAKKGLVVSEAGSFLRPSGC